ncbi:hypothetical protein NDU88_005057 [Pleurodeles waltl]|uniref:Uncharacterized protein n=1 Tax=Pleurodeles waltl TaxID=8319 RepID=A0AAV7V6M0_PLEWA|nr:hypothetical protein NDU88_005057 [Pleurodeles waltl]
MLRSKRSWPDVPGREVKSMQDLGHMHQTWSSSYRRRERRFTQLRRSVSPHWCPNRKLKFYNHPVIDLSCLTDLPSEAVLWAYL